VAAGLLVGLVAACGRTNEVHRAAGIVPADALAYVSVTLDPSLLQKKDLFQIGRRFPAAARLIAGNFDVSRDNLLQAAVQKVCLDYRADVKPWLGSELALALLPPPRGGNAPAAAVFIKVDNRARAAAALDRVSGKRCPAASGGAVAAGSADSGGSAGSAGSAVQYRFVNGYAVVVAERTPADGTVILDAVDNEAAKGTGGLAATPAFANAVARLAGDRLAVGWVDAPALARVVASGGRSVRGTDVSSLGNCDVGSLGLGPAAGQVAFDVRATPSSLLLEGVIGGSTKALAKGPAAITAGLPGSSLGEATVFGLGPIVRAALSCTGLADKAASSFNQATGLDLDNDVLAQLGGESALVVGPVPAGARLPEVGFVTAIADHARAERAARQVAATLQANGEDVSRTTIAGVLAFEVSIQRSSDLLAGVRPTFAVLPDRLVVASTPGYLAELASRAPDPLGSAADYRDAVGAVAGDATAGQLLVRFGPIRAALEAALTGSAKATFERRIAPDLAALRDLVARSYVRDGLARFEVRLTFA
jgi:hypothetical protein